MATICTVCNKKLGYFDDIIFIDFEGTQKEVHRVCSPNTNSPPGTSDGAVTNPSVQTSSIQNSADKPSIIGVLAGLGWLLFIVLGLSGLQLIDQNESGSLGLALIIGGVFQLSIFLGFSAIIDQLYQINLNTSQFSKSGD